MLFLTHSMSLVAVKHRVLCVYMQNKKKILTTCFPNVIRETTTFFLLLYYPYQ